MKKVYAKRLKEYEVLSEFETEKILEAMKRSKKRRKPTSVALDEETIEDLKKLADKKKHSLSSADANVYYKWVKKNEKSGLGVVGVLAINANILN